MNNCRRTPPVSGKLSDSLTIWRFTCEGSANRDYNKEDPQTIRGGDQPPPAADGMQRNNASEPFVNCKRMLGSDNHLQALADRQNAHTRLGWVDGQQCTSIEGLSMLLQSRKNEMADSFRRRVLRADLDDAGATSPGVSQECTEIQVVGKHNEAILLRVREDGSIGRCGDADLRPVGVNADIAQPVNPAGRKVHVEVELHDAVSGSSCSSVRQAA